MARRRVTMYRALGQLAALAVLLAPAAPLPATQEPAHFEAAFQGTCSEASPCEQLCRELHDGTYECGCSPGFVLHVNGYGCLELNDTSKPSDNPTFPGEDVLYQKVVSFSAELEIAEPSTRLSKTDLPYSKTDLPNSKTRKHIDKELKNVKDKDISQGNQLNNDISYIGEKYKEIDGLRRLISDGVSQDDINMISNDNDKTLDNNDMYNVGKDKVTTLGPSLEQKVPGATSSPLWTTAVGSCNCNPCDNTKCSCPGTTKKCGHRISTPRFSGTSWLAFHALRGAYKRVRLRFRVRPERARGVLLLTGEHDDLSGDYLALVLHQGHVELRFDCGSGSGVLRSPEPVRLGRWNTISVYRHRWDAWLRLNEGKKVRGRSKGLFSRMTFREPVWVGGAGNTTGLLNKLGLSDGLLGCVDFLRINGDTYRLMKDSVATSDIAECAPALSPWKPETIPTMDTIPIQNHPNEIDSHIYNINDIVHFEDNDIVMRDAKNDINNSIKTNYNLDGIKTKTNIVSDNTLDDVLKVNADVNNDLKIEDHKVGEEDKCVCEHGGGCVGELCLCPLGYAGDKCEITLDLKVPRFNGSSYLRLPGLGNTALSWLDLQVTLKPSSATGLVLYNADHASGDGDFFSLHLRDYFVEFAFDLGSGIALVRSAYPLKPNTWHHIAVNRSGRHATLRVRTDNVTNDYKSSVTTERMTSGDNVANSVDQATRSVTSRGVAKKLSLRQPLMLGGAPRPLPQRLALTESYSGCVSQLVINDEEISVVSSALGGVNVDNCEDPVNYTCGNQDCRENLEIIPEYLKENRTQLLQHHTIVPKKGIYKHHRSKIKKHNKTEKYLRNYLKKSKHFQNNYGRSNEIITAEPQRYIEVQYLDSNDINWGDTNSYPSFTGKDSFIHMDDEETMKRLLSFSLDINIRFRCVYPHGLLVWSGKTRPKDGNDFLSLGIEDSVLVFRYDLGSGEVVIVANHTKVDDGLWHRARATRNRQAGVLEVDGLGSVGKISPGKLKQLNTENGLYIGGIPSIEINTIGKYKNGLIGCVSQISLSGDFDIPLSLSKLPHTITNNVGRCAP